MKVCFVSHTSRCGGAERSLLEIVRALQRRGVACVALLPRRGALERALEELEVEYAVLPYRWWNGPEGGPVWKRAARIACNLAVALPASLWIRRRGCGIVYTNTLTVCTGALAAALAGRKHVWHIRELGHDHNRMVFDLGERLSLSMIRRLSDAVLANSSCVADRYREAVGEEKLRVVYQGVQVEEGGGAPELGPRRGFRCAVVGSITPAKRQEEAIGATALLRDRGIPVELLIVGEGDEAYERRLRDLAAELGVEDRVMFLGELESAYPVIRQADAVVQCSRYEAFGRVTVEGMLAGKPVVGARSCGTAELIRDGFNGLLYEMGDVEQLAGLLRRLIEHPEQARRIGAAARSWAAERFTERRFGDEILDCLRGLHGADPGHAGRWTSRPGRPV